LDISLPVEPVYYYECSAGAFRLTYFIPPEELLNLVAEERIRPSVVEEFPDGVDLDCTAPDFAEFEERFGYRPEADPDALQAAFFAMLSSTRDWQRFRGTGLLPKADLERLLDPVAVELEREGLEPSGRPDESLHRPLVERRRTRVAHVRNEARKRRTLERMKVREVDSRRDIRQQAFSEIRRSPGRSAAEVFDSLHRNRKGDRGR